MKGVAWLLLLTLVSLTLLSPGAALDVFLTNMTIYQTHEPSFFFFEDPPEVYLTCNDGRPDIDLEDVDDVDLTYRFEVGEVLVTRVDESDSCVRCELMEADTGFFDEDDRFGSFDLCLSQFRDSGSHVVMIVDEFRAGFQCPDCLEKAEPEARLSAPAVPTPALSPALAPTPALSPALAPTPAISPSLAPTPAISPSLAPTPAISPSLAPTPAISPSLAPTPAISPALAPTPAPSPGSQGSQASVPGSEQAIEPEMTPSVPAPESLALGAPELLTQPTSRPLVPEPESPKAPAPTPQPKEQDAHSENELDVDTFPGPPLKDPKKEIDILPKHRYDFTTTGMFSRRRGDEHPNTESSDDPQGTHDHFVWTHPSTHTSLIPASGDGERQVVVDESGSTIQFKGSRKMVITK